jgi:hypothetical protein
MLFSFIYSFDTYLELKIKTDQRNKWFTPYPIIRLILWKNMSVLKISCDNLHGLNGRIAYPLGWEGREKIS